MLRFSAPIRFSSSEGYACFNTLDVKVQLISFSVSLSVSNGFNTLDVKVQRSD